ncbi:MAG TPA: peptidase, partial [Bdellovibrionales bacterium]|nr:peptidase [Bdellovibrionales bacterium]
DTDNTVFRPAQAARDGVEEDLSPVPDGFYVVGDTESPRPEFQKAIVDSVRRVTHIAQPDANGMIIGRKIEQEGVINYPVKKLLLCAGAFAPEYVTTTEVYPDSPKVTARICVEAQIAAITGGLLYVGGLN